MAKPRRSTKDRISELLDRALLATLRKAAKSGHIDAALVNAANNRLKTPGIGSSPTVKSNREIAELVNRQGLKLTDNGKLLPVEKTA